MKAVIIGATGLTGSLLTEKIAASDRFTSVTALARREGGINKKKISYKITDFENLSGLKIKADSAFSCLGTTIKTAGSSENFRKVDFTYNLEFARVCRKNGIERFILLSALGADPGSRVFYSRVKGELEEEIKSLGFRYLTIVRPSLLEGPRAEWRSGEYIARKIMKLINPLLAGRLKKFRSVNIEALTDVMLNEAYRKEPGIRIIENDEIL